MISEETLLIQQCVYINFEALRKWDKQRIDEDYNREYVDFDFGKDVYDWLDEKLSDTKARKVTGVSSYARHECRISNFSCSCLCFCTIQDRLHEYTYNGAWAPLIGVTKIDTKMEELPCLEAALL